MIDLNEETKMYDVNHDGGLIRKGVESLCHGLKKMSAVLFILCGVCLSTMISTGAGAQVTGATVSGTLADPSGAAIPTAQLVITNVATGIKTTANTNASGFYRAPNLPPGTYSMTITSPGFTTEERSGIILEVGAELVQNITLKVGQATERVEVTAATPGVELASSTIGAVVGSKAVVELPLNGRSWTDLANLEPGAAQLQVQAQFDNAQDASNRGTKGFGTQTSIDGARPSQNNYRLDGISVNDSANGPPSNVIGETPGVDAIAEFSVLTSNYSAEYGLTSGGVINAITRSGNNQLHGTAYEFLRNSALDARTYFDGPQIPAFRRNQFGGSIGGPIRKERTFFFANYEGLRQLQGNTSISVVPSAAARAGTLCSQPSLATASSPCTTSTVTVNAAATAYLPFFPLPNAGLLPTGHGDTGDYDLVINQITSDNFFTSRIDHVISDRDHIDGTFVIERSPFSSPDSLDNNIVGFIDNYQVYSVEETHIFSANWVNTVRAGAFRQYNSRNIFIAAINPLSTNQSLASQAGYDAAAVSISGITTFNGGSIGLNSGFAGITNFQLYDDASWVHGTHTVKYGFAGEKQVFNVEAVPAVGTWSFGSLQGFLTNAPTSYSASPVLTAPAERGLRDTVLGGYVQDSWRWRPNLTFNYGLRYEAMTALREAHGYVTSLTSLTAATPRVGNNWFENNPTVHNFEPRIGFVWDPFHNGKTSVRGGFGLFDVLPMAYQWSPNSIVLAPFELKDQANSLPAGTFYSGVAPYLTPATQTAMYMEQKPHRSYIMQRNFSLQREVAPNLTATLSYVGSTGEHLRFGVGDADAVYPTLSSAGYLYPQVIGSGTKANTNWGKVEEYLFNSPSFYNSAQVNVAKRMSHGFQIEGSFTWEKSIDNSSSNVSNNDYNNSVSSPAYWGKNASRGLSDFDEKRVFVANGIWQIPEAKNLPTMAGRLVNGWQLGTIFKMGDGMPFTPTFGTGGNVAGFNNSANTQSDYPDRLGGAGCSNAVHPQNAANYVNLNCFSLPTAPSLAFWTANCDTTSLIYGSPKTKEPYPVCFNLIGNAGRNSVTGPGIVDTDISLFKNNYIKKRLNAQFRAEIFNIFNRPNFAPPVVGSTSDLFNGTGVPNGSAGVLTELSTSSRQVQFALKLIW